MNDKGQKTSLSGERQDMPVSAPAPFPPLPLSVLLLIVLAGFGLVPLLGRAGAHQSRSNPGGRLLGPIYVAWVGSITLSIAYLSQKFFTAYGTAKAGKVVATFTESLTTGETLLAVYAAFGVAATLVSISAVYILRRWAAGASLFSSFYTLVAALSATLSSFTSFLGVQLVFQTETPTLYSNWVLPLLLSSFILAFALALWIGGASLINTRHWTRDGGDQGILLGFVERITKWVLLGVPALALFVLSTWTSALGLGGRDAVRLHYSREITRIVAECERATLYTANEEAFLISLDQTVENLVRLAEEEQRGALSGLDGAGPAAAYLTRLSDWLGSVAGAAREQIDIGQGADRQAEWSKDCLKDGNSLSNRLKKIETTGFKKWERSFALAFDKVRAKTDARRARPTVITFVETQLNAMDLRVVPPQVNAGPAGVRITQTLSNYTDKVDQRLRELITQYDLTPPEPLPPTTTWTIVDWLDGPAPVILEEPVIEADEATSKLPGLQQISARQAIWQYGYLAFDIWAFAISWDFASYALIIFYVFFPGLGEVRPRRRHQTNSLSAPASSTTSSYVAFVFAR